MNTRPTSVTELNLIAALRALACNASPSSRHQHQVAHSQSQSSRGSADSHDLSAVASIDLGVNSEVSKTIESKALSSAELLRLTHCLVGGLLQLQRTNGSDAAPHYLGQVLPCLFRLLHNDIDENVRIAADEGINKLIKLLRVSMAHQVVFEVFLELKRNLNSRSVIACIKKFAGLVHRIRSSKRRFYVTNLLTVLVTLCQSRTEEFVFEVLANHFSVISSQLLQYATEKELKSFVNQLFFHLSADSVIIRRSASQLIVQTCQHARRPMPLFYWLLGYLIDELTVSSSATTPLRISALLITLRHLSVAWEILVHKSTTDEYDRLTRNNLSTSGCVAACPETGGSDEVGEQRKSLTAVDDPLSSHWAPPGSFVSAINPLLLTAGNDLLSSSSAGGQQLWSYAFLTALAHATSNSSIGVIVSALEAVLQMITVRRPACLFTRQWLVNCRDGSLPVSFCRLQVLASDNESTDRLLLPDSYHHREYQFETPVEDSSRHSSLTTLTPEPCFGPEDDPQFRRSCSLASTTGSPEEVGLDPDRDDQSFGEEIGRQLGAIRARASRSVDKEDGDGDGDEFTPVPDISAAEEKDNTIGDPAGGGEDGLGGQPHEELAELVASDAGDLLTLVDASPSLLSSDGGGGGSVNGRSSAAPPRPIHVTLLNLHDLLKRLSLEEPVDLVQCDWLIAFLTLHFGLISSGTAARLGTVWPQSSVPTRICTQHLALACLTQLVQLSPQTFLDCLELERCCRRENYPSSKACEVSQPTGISLIVDLLHQYEDPQLRAELCLLAGQVIASCLVHHSLQLIGGQALEEQRQPTGQLSCLLSCLEQELTAESSGISVRHALTALRLCANPILHLSSRQRDEKQPTGPLVHRLYACIGRHLASLARHSYRLVRREFLDLVLSLDWLAVDHFEVSVYHSSTTTSGSHRLIRSLRLIDLAWVESWRLLSDANPDLRETASAALLRLASLTTGEETGQHRTVSQLAAGCLRTRLRYWFPYDLGPAGSYSASRLLHCLNPQTLPPCLTNLPEDMDVGPSGWQHRAHPGADPSETLSLEQTGVLRLFRECVAALLELPVPSLVGPDNHQHMLHGVFRCLNRLIGQSHVLSYSVIWYDQPPTASDRAAPAPVADGQLGEESLKSPRGGRRSRLTLVAWHSLTLLSTTAITWSNLDLLIELVHFCVGCLTRWSLYAGTEESLSVGQSECMHLDLHHSYTQFALTLLQHVSRVLFIMAYVVQEKRAVAETGQRQPPLSASVATESTASLSADPLQPEGAAANLLASIAKLAKVDAVGSVLAAASQAISSKGVRQTVGSTPAMTAVDDGGTVRLPGTVRQTTQQQQHPSETTSTGSASSDGARRQLGYFAHLPHYLTLFHTLETTFNSYKISPDLSGDQDQFMLLIKAYLQALSRIITGLRFAQTAPYTDELLSYVGILYQWQPAACLEAFTQMLRTMVGTNLLGLWDEKFVDLYNTCLGRAGKACPAGGQESLEGIESLLDQLVTDECEHTMTLISGERTLIDPVIATASSDQSADDRLLASRTPLKAWIRFARQFHNPVPLTSTAPFIKSELTRFFRRVEHLVLHSISSYRWSNCKWLQTGTLNLLTHLIGLQLKYDQLDTKRTFVKTILDHCSSLPLEMVHFGASSSSPVTRQSSSASKRSSSSVGGGGGAADVEHPGTLLVKAIFSFLVELSWNYRSTASGTPVEEGSLRKSTRVPKFSEITHLAETLTAELIEPDPFASLALVPIVVDLYVMRRPSEDSPAERQETEVQREAMLNFILRQLSHLPASYHLLRIIVEEEGVSQDRQIAQQTVVQILDALLGHLSTGLARLRRSADVESLLRLFDHLVLVLGTRSMTPDACFLSLVHRLMGRLVEPLSVWSKEAFSELTTSPAVKSPHPLHWVVEQVTSCRLFWQLHCLLMTSSPEEATRVGSTGDIDPLSPVDFKLTRVSLRLLYQLMLMLHRQLMANTQSAAALVSNQLTATADEAPARQVLMQLRLVVTHLSTVLQMAASAGATDILQVYSASESREWAAFEDVWGLGEAQISNLTQLISVVGIFEPTLAALWSHFYATCAPHQLDASVLTTAFNVSWPDSPSARGQDHHSMLGLHQELAVRCSWLALLGSSQVAASAMIRLSSLLFFNSDPHTPPTASSTIASRNFLRLLNMLQCRSERSLGRLISDVQTCPQASQLLLQVAVYCLPVMTIVEQRWLLSLLSGGRRRRLHPDTSGQQLSLLWDHFIASRPSCRQRVKSQPRNGRPTSCCPMCRRNPLPLGLQHQACRLACEILTCDQVAISLPLAVLMDLAARLPQSAQFRGLAMLRSKLEQLINQVTTRVTGGDDESQGRPGSPALGFDKEPVCTSLPTDANAWLLTVLQSLLSLKTVPLATNREQAIATLTKTLMMSSSEEQQATVVGLLRRSLCSHHCVGPRLLSHLLLLGAPGALEPVESDQMPIGSKSLGGCPMGLFRTAQCLLFEHVQNLVSSPAILVHEVSDPTLQASLQSYLTGLTVALRHFLRLSAYLPYRSADLSGEQADCWSLLPIECEALALAFLRLMAEFLLYLLGCPLSELSRIGPTTRETRPVGPPSPSLVHQTLYLLDDLLHTALCHHSQGVDLIESSRAEGPSQGAAPGCPSATLTLFVRLLTAIDRRTSASTPACTWDDLSANWQANGHTLRQQISRLLTPVLPSLFLASWEQGSPLPASLLSTYSHLMTAVVNVTSALAGPSQNQLTSRSESVGHPLIGQLFGRCRLLRSHGRQAAANTAASGLDNGLYRCLIGCMRLQLSRCRDQRTASEEPEAQPEEEEEHFQLLTHDPDALALSVGRFGAVGWLERRQFENMWASLLQVLTSVTAADQPALEEEASVLECMAAELETVESNQLLVLGLHGLTRLLTDAALRPRSGDILYSRLHHQPRLATPNFLHTRLGRKLTYLVDRIHTDSLRLCDANADWSAVVSLPLPGQTDGPVSRPNLERLACPPVSQCEGPSQLAVDWLVHRVVPANRFAATASEEDSQRSGWRQMVSGARASHDERGDGDGASDAGADAVVTGQELSSSVSSPLSSMASLRRSSLLHRHQGRQEDYRDILLSCLQSLQLLFLQIWRSRSSVQQPRDGEEAQRDAADGGRQRLASDVAPRVESLPPLVVCHALVRASVIISDLFTTRQQYLWLHGFLVDIQEKLPPLTDFPIPLHYWLTLGLARCTAVLDLHTNSQCAEQGEDPSSSSSFASVDAEPCVRQMLMALKASMPSLQDAGLQAVLVLLHATVLIHSQPQRGQRQLPVGNPPTGSVQLNNLYFQTCEYLRRSLITLFSQLTSPASQQATSLTVNISSSISHVGHKINSPLDIGKPSTLSAGDSVRLKSKSGAAGFRRLMANVFTGGGKSSQETGQPGSMKEQTTTLEGRIEHHQLTVLAASFFLSEHFSGPPVHPVPSDSTYADTELLSDLTYALFSLAPVILSNAPVDFPASNASQTYYAPLSAGTSADLAVTPAVQEAWCQGTERLVLTNRLGKCATETLLKLCVLRLRTCRSPHISLPALRLLLTCMYTSTGRLNTQLLRFTSSQQGETVAAQPESRGGTAAQTTGEATATIGVKPEVVVGKEKLSVLKLGRRLKQRQEEKETSASASPKSRHASPPSTSERQKPAATSTTTGELSPTTDLSDVNPTALLRADVGAILGMLQEFLTCLWERLRGGLAPVSPRARQTTDGGEPTWLNSAWTSLAEAQLVSLVLAQSSAAVVPKLRVASTSASASTRSLVMSELMQANNLAEVLLNKALTEFSRLDNANPLLAGRTLVQLFQRFLRNQSGQKLILQWMLLSLPTLLGRRPRSLALWSSTVCLLASCSGPTLRSVLCLCPVPDQTCDQAVADSAPDNNQPLQSLRDLLHLAAVHLLRFGLLRRLEGRRQETVAVENTRDQERRLFVAIFATCRPEGEPSDDDSLAAVLSPVARHLEWLLIRDESVNSPSPDDD